jgi:hypothetical protein
LVVQLSCRGWDWELLDWPLDVRQGREGAVRVLGGADSHTANVGNAGAPARFGAGLDLVAVVYPRTAVGGTFRLRSSNGNTALTFTNSFAPTPVRYRVDVVFGSVDDSFLLAGGLGGGSGSLSGTVDGGGRTNGNVFDQGPSWARRPEFRLVNSPRAPRTT